MAKKAKPPSPFTGRWRIVSMSAWEDDFLDEGVEAYIEFNDQGWGDFHFGNVQGQMDCRPTTKDGEPSGAGAAGLVGPTGKVCS
jgi:hypothetical protein